MLFPTNRLYEFENLFGNVVEESAPTTTTSGIHIHVDHLTDQQAALFAFGQNLPADAAVNYMQQLLTSALAPAPTALPAPAPAPADDDDILVDIAQVVDDRIKRAIPGIAEAINLSNTKAAKVTSLESKFAADVAANPADAVTLANKLAAAKAKVEAATTVSEVNAVKL